PPSSFVIKPESPISAKHSPYQNHAARRLQNSYTTPLCGLLAFNLNRARSSTSPVFRHEATLQNMTPTLLSPETSSTEAQTERVISFPASQTYEAVEAARQRTAEAARKVRTDLRMGREHQAGSVNWITAIFMGLFHVGAI